MKKSVLKQHKKDSPMYVYLHGLRQKSRGRRPSMPFQGEKNPKKAFELAKECSYFSMMVKTGTYRCDYCGSTNQKLWRKASGFMSPVLCSGCIEKHEEVKPFDVTSAGLILGSEKRLLDTYVPAIPTQEDPDFFFTQKAMPPRILENWFNLPTR